MQRQISLSSRELQIQSHFGARSLARLRVHSFAVITNFERMTALTKVFWYPSPYSSFSGSISTFSPVQWERTTRERWAADGDEARGEKVRSRVNWGRRRIQAGRTFGPRLIVKAARSPSSSSSSACLFPPLVAASHRWHASSSWVCTTPGVVVVVVAVAGVLREPLGNFGTL